MPTRADESSQRNGSGCHGQSAGEHQRVTEPSAEYRSRWGGVLPGEVPGVAAAAHLIGRSGAAPGRIYQAVPSCAAVPWRTSPINTRYVFAYPAQASWAHFTTMLFDNPASGSAGQDMILTNVVLFPLWTIIDGRRRGLHGTWVYFVMSLFTSFGFAMGMYLAAQERQVRWLPAQKARGAR